MCLLFGTIKNVSVSYNIHLCFCRALDKTDLKGSTINVELSTTRVQKATKLFVGNLPEGTKSAEVIYISMLMRLNSFCQGGGHKDF